MGRSVRTQVIIIGGGPSGLLLGQLRFRRGIESVILERKSRGRVLGRIRAGVLETGPVTLLEEAGVADRLHAEGDVHRGTPIAVDGSTFRVDFHGLTGTPPIVYGQAEITRDLYDARAKAGLRTEFEVDHVQIHNPDGNRPHVTFGQGRADHRIDGDVIVGCDGFHGVSRRTIPLTVRRDHEKTHPLGWLGVLSRTPPVHDELIYASSDRGVALCSMRNADLSRCCIQCALSDHPEDCTVAPFWSELKHRLPAEVAELLITGPSIEKAIAPLRSFMTERMRWGRLFLCGGTEGIGRHSRRALLRVWKAERFSWWFSGLLHRFSDQSPFDLKMQRAELALLRDNESQQRAFAENHVGLPH